MILTHDQQTAHDAIVEFARHGSGHVTVGGYAGTGKTTVTAAAVRTLRSIGKNNIAFCCFTGKASSVLRSKLIETQSLLNGYCGTIHSLMYKPIPNSRPVRFKRVDSIDADLLVADEASMIPGDVWRDLTSYRIPVIAVGDHGQLPPVNDTFNLMEKPMHRLEKIHRQAEGNPIIKLSMMARETGQIPYGAHGPGVFHGNMTDDRIIAQAAKYDRLRSTLFLSGFNKTRVRLNAKIRAALGYSGDPGPGEKVICLKNNRDEYIFNGVGGVIQTIQRNGSLFYEAKIDMDDGVPYAGRVVASQFGAPETLREHPHIEEQALRDLFDFGYCLTVHKAQGSEADSVTLLAERSSHSSDDQWRRWLYTGVTRAKKYLTIVNRRFDQSKAREEKKLNAAFIDTVGLWP